MERTKLMCSEMISSRGNTTLVIMFSKAILYLEIIDNFQFNPFGSLLDDKVFKYITKNMKVGFIDYIVNETQRPSIPTALMMRVLECEKVRLLDKIFVHPRLLTNDIGKTKEIKQEKLENFYKAFGFMRVQPNCEIFIRENNKLKG